jgi:hypothetical protein
MKILNPASHLALTIAVKRRTELDNFAAAKLATALIRDLQEQGLDVVREDWINQEPVSLGWNDLAAVAEQLTEERGGVPPWRTPELA